MILNKNSLNDWRRDNGDLTLMLSHDLNKDSIVLDIGAYTGVWISQMLPKYDCNYYAMEPISKFYNILNKKYEQHSKVRCLHTGIGTCNERRKINISGDASSIFGDGQGEEIVLCDLETFMNLESIQKIDLLQINIEGMEYEILNHWIETGVLKKIDKLLIQFHYIEGIDSVAERIKIQNHLSLCGFKECFSYPFVWEGWERIK
jgi:FkbM family methyltransferase